MTIQVEFNNYKLLKDFRAELKSGNIYFVKGNNGKGKTSFLQGLLATIRGKNSNKNLASFDSQEGHVKTQIQDFKGADGENYTIKFNFADGKDDRFTIIRPDTTVSKKSGDITSIFQYNAFTVDEFFSWGTTAEGRRKQAAIIMNMLPLQVQNEIRDIDSKVNERNGTLVEQRKKANAVVEAKNIEVSNIKFTPNEIKMKDFLLQNPNYTQITEEMQDALDNASKTVLSSTDDLLKKQSLENKISNLEDLKERTIEDFTQYKSNTQKEIDELKSRIIALTESFKTKGLEVQALIDSKNKEIETETLALKELSAKLDAKKLPNIEELQKDLDERNPYMDLYYSIENKEKAMDEKKREYIDTKTVADSLNISIVELRKRKIDLIAAAKLPVDNIAIDGDEIFYVTPEGLQIPFSEENLSYSKGGLVVAQIMLAVNQSLPLLLVGKAAEYDNDSLAQLCQLAEKNDAIVILDRVIPEATNLQIECYEGSSSMGVTTKTIPTETIKTTETVSISNTKPLFNL